MKVKLLVSRCGPAGSQVSGNEIDVSADEAGRLIESGQAVPVRTSVKGKPEKAVKDS